MYALAAQLHRVVSAIIWFWRYDGDTRNSGRHLCLPSVMTWRLQESCLVSCWVCSRRNTLLTTRFCVKTLHVFDISTRRQGAGVNQTVRCLTTRYFPSCGRGGRTITVSLRWILKGTGFKVRMILVFRQCYVLAHYVHFVIARAYL